MEEQKQKNNNSSQQWKLREIHLLPIVLHILFIFSAHKLTSTIAGFLHKRHWRFVARVCFQPLLKGENLIPPQHISSTGYSARLVNWKLCVCVYIFFLLTLNFSSSGYHFCQVSERVSSENKQQSEQWRVGFPAPSCYTGWPCPLELHSSKSNTGRNYKKSGELQEKYFESSTLFSSTGCLSKNLNQEFLKKCRKSADSMVYKSIPCSDTKPSYLSVLYLHKEDFKINASFTSKFYYC